MYRSKDLNKYFEGFSKLERPERFQRLLEMGVISIEDVQFLQAGGIQDVSLAESFIENVIGYFQIPLGVATNFNIDGRDQVIPMAVEETSIIAAASKTAKWIKQNGNIKTQNLGKEIIGQVQLSHIRNFENFKMTIEQNKQFLIQEANAKVASQMVKRGGGVREIYVRQIPRGDGTDMAVIHVLADTCNAMGANIINQVCEFLKPMIEALTSEKVTMCILSNLVDTKLTRAQVLINKIDPVLGERIAEASLFAQNDPYRAATNNKGVLNGIDPVLVATGNDWRAVEAGVHSYAARTGQYRSITRWVFDGKNLMGTLVAPICVGTVGGVTALHPTAQLCLKMLKVNNANELSRIVAAVGLVQNLGAIRALVSEGITQGHMRLHIQNLALSAGATEVEIPLIKKILEGILAKTKRISLSHAVEALSDLREKEALT
ncbi:MAG: hydroxymethylglutaryl-CoA reductase, degradative [Pseudomonadota bacterium]|nr:hydroxymethylglutaryl-CoA reductase, degradative [Pseudomonadota bacterium]